MRTAAFTSLLLATAASAQIGALGPLVNSVSSPLELGKLALNYVSSDCKATVVSLAAPNSTLYQCLKVDALLPALTTNGSVIPPVDKYLSTVCSSQPCDNATITSTTDKVYKACSSDLDKFGVSKKTFYDAMNLYPVARDVACLKTTKPEAYSHATIPINSTAYNTTNGTFCVTDLATDLSGYLGVNLTNSYIDSAVLGGNSTAFNLAKQIPPTALCTDCVAAAYGIVSKAVPQVKNITIIPSLTVDRFLNLTCSRSNTTFSSNGTLPSTVHSVAINSTLKSNTSSVSSASGWASSSTSAVKRRAVAQL